MPKRKKKPGTLKLQKVEQARHRNEFVNQFRTVISTAFGSRILSLIPLQEIEDLYAKRFQPLLIKAHPGQRVPHKILQFSKRLLRLMFKDQSLPLEIGGLQLMTVYDIYTIGHTIWVYAHKIQRPEYAIAEEVKEALAPLGELETVPAFVQAWSYYHQILNLISITTSDLSQNMYALQDNKKPVADSLDKLGFGADMYCFKSPVAQIHLDGIPRPAYRLGWPLGEPSPHLDFITVRSEAIQLPPGNTFDVYIQSHVLHRLAERLDNVYTGLLHFNIWNSFKDLKVCRNRKNDLLFEYRLFENKAGYFTGQVKDNKIILTTFLFLTNNGTPESEMLYANTGMLKEDKAYLSIDRLSTFVHSDIAANERIRQLFVDAGCESLFNISKVFCEIPEGEGERSMAGFIEKYLQLGTQHLPVPVARQDPMGWKKRL